ncbi:MAG: helix-turn-helix transcriptional regulator, partial [Acidobacteriota bacterium]
EALAARVHLSPRQFARVFAAELGMPPARYVAQVRIEEAKRQLESTESSLAQIARACGFSSAEAFSRVFNRIVGVPPATFRRRFAARLVAPPPP